MTHYKHEEMERQARASQLLTQEDFDSTAASIPKRKPAVDDHRRIVKEGERCKNTNTEWRTGATEMLKLGFEALKVLQSGVVPENVGDARNEQCWKCPHSLGVEEEGEVLHYCLCCNCGTWSDKGQDGSAIEYKNRHASHYCSRPDPAFIAYTGPTITAKVPMWRVVPRMLMAWRASNQLPNQLPPEPRE